MNDRAADNSVNTTAPGTERPLRKGRPYSRLLLLGVLACAAALALQIGRLAHDRQTEGGVSCPAGSRAEPASPASSANVASTPPVTTRDAYIRVLQASNYYAEVNLSKVSPRVAAKFRQGRSGGKGDVRYLFVDDVTWRTASEELKAAYEEISVYLGRQSRRPTNFRAIADDSTSLRMRLKAFLAWSDDSAPPQATEHQVILGTENAKLLRLRANQTGITATALVLQPRTDTKKGTIVFLCGNGSTPERAIGAGPEDYQRFVAKRLCNEGYAVYVPYLLTLTANNASIDRLALPYGLTHVHFDIWRLKALVDHLAVKEQQTVWLYGISHGGFNALLYAAVDERAAGVICSGSLCDSLAMLRHYIKVSGDAPPYPLDAWTGLGLAVADVVELAELVYPRKLAFEQGTHDLRPEAAEIFDRLQSRYDSTGSAGNLELLLFDGFHEINLQMTLPLLDRWCSQGRRP